jgi:hypothetical protein
VGGGGYQAKILVHLGGYKRKVREFTRYGCGEFRYRVHEVGDEC